jgi:uncharacterized protein (DUF1697 family)
MVHVGRGLSRSTVLSSGNVVFSARAAPERSLARQAEDALNDGLGRTFLTIVRSLDSLREILDSDPYAPFRLSPGSKRVVTFLRQAPESKLSLLWRCMGRASSPRGGARYSAVFMQLIEKTLGEEVTTRTWETVGKVVGDHRSPRSASGPRRLRVKRR